MTPEAARHAALRDFGNVASVQERTREERDWVCGSSRAQDGRYAGAGSPGRRAFTAIVWGTLVVGIGLAAAIIGLTSPTLFAPQADGLQLIGYKDKRTPFAPIRPGLHWEAYREQVKSFSGLGAVYRENQNVVIQGRPVIATALRASND